MRELKALAEEYKWEDDDPLYMKRKAELIKKYQKLAGKKNVSTAQEDADERKPRITSWEPRGGADHKGLQTGGGPDDPPHPTGRVGV